MSVVDNRQCFICGIPVDGDGYCVEHDDRNQRFFLGQRRIMPRLSVRKASHRRRQAKRQLFKPPVIVLPPEPDWDAPVKEYSGLRGW